MASNEQSSLPELQQKELVLPFNPWIERLGYFALGLHGLFMLSFVGGEWWQWTAVIVAALLGITVQPTLSQFRLVRLMILSLITWLLLFSTGGTGSFFLLWYFAIVSVSPLILEKTQSLAFIFVIPLSYSVLLFLQPSSVPAFVVVARTFLLFFMGGGGYVLTKATQTTLLINEKFRQALEQNVQRLELAGRAANLIVWTWDIPNNSVTWQEMGQPVLRKDGADYPNTFEGFLATVHSEDGARVKETIMQAVSGGSEYSLEFRVRDANGRIRWLLSHGQVHTDAAGEPVMLVGLNQDITERKVASQTVEEQARLLNIVSEAIIATDENFVVQSWNNAAVSMYGWTPEEAIGEKLGNLMFTDFGPGGREGALAHLHSTGLWRGEVEQTSKSEGKITVLSSVSAIKDKKGKFVGSVSVNRDISERQLIEKALQESEELYRTLVEALPITITVTNQTLETIFANQTAATMFGYKCPEDMYGPVKWETVSNYPSSFIEERAALIQSGEATQPQIYRVRRQDGQEIIIEASSTPVIFGGQPVSLGIAVDVTNQKRLEAAQQAYTQQLARAHEIAQIATWQWDLRTDDVIWSEEMYRIFGVEPGLVTPSLDSHLSFVHPEDRKILPDARAGIKQRGFVKPIEFRIIRGDGEERFIWADGEVTFDENGRPQKMTGILQDITHRKQEELALRRSQTHLKLAQATASMGSWEYNPKTEEIYWSDEMYQIFNHDPQKAPLSLEEYRQSIHPQSVEMVMETVTQAFAQGEAATIEFMTLQEKGTIKYLRASFQPIFSDRGEYVLMVGTVTDITEHYETEIALHQEAQRNLLILNTMQDGYILADNEGNIVEVNPAYCQMIGYAREDLLTMNIRRIEAQLSPEQVTERIEQMVAAGKTNFETKHQAQDGRFIDLDVSVFVMDTGAAPLVAAFTRNITDRKRAEAEIKQRNREMTSLLQISQHVGQLLNLQDLLDAILTAVIDTIPNADAASIWFYDEAQEHLAPRAWINHNDAEMSSVTLSPDTSMVGQIYRMQKPLIFQDAQVESSFQKLNATKLDSVRSVMGVPFVMQNNVVMVLFADCFSQANAFNDDDLRWLQSLTGQVAVMVQNARLFATEKQARKTAEILQSANLALTQTLNLDTILNTFLVSLAQLVPYDTANVMLRTQNHEVTLVALNGYKTEEHANKVRGLTFNIYQDPIAHQVIVEQQSIRIADTRKNEAWVGKAGAEHVISWMGIPFIAEGKVIGLYAIDKSEPNYFTEAHQRLAQALSAQAAVAIRNAQLLQALQISQDELQALTVHLQSAREDEQKRISYEIHDQFGQLLTAIKMNLAWLNKQCRPEDQHLIEKINNISALSDDAIAVARRVARELRPGLLDDLGLAAALEWHLQEFTQHTEIVTSLTIDPALQIDQTELAVTIFRIVQEALTNVARHANATQAQVLLKLEPQGLLLSVIDNGRGITQVQKSGKQSLGLLGIRERARAWQGEVQIEGQNGIGTSIIVQIPQKTIRNL